MTIALPDHDDLPLLKTSMITQKSVCNNRKQQITAVDEKEMEKEKQVVIVSLFNQGDLFYNREFE